jgi:hypothetical protein
MPEHGRDRGPAGLVVGVPDEEEVDVALRGASVQNRRGEAPGHDDPVAAEVEAPQEV